MTKQAQVKFLLYRFKAVVLLLSSKVLITISPIFIVTLVGPPAISGLGAFLRCIRFGWLRLLMF